MSKKSVFCIANCRNLAELIVDQLKFYGISSRDVSVLYPDVEGNGRKTHYFDGDQDVAATDAAATGLSNAASIRGTLGWIMGIGALAVPGAGTFIAAGPIIESLRSPAAGGSTGTIAGGLIRMGISESQARHYEDRIRLGNILISMHTESPAEAMQAKFIFTRGRAQDICITDEAFRPQERNLTERDRSGLPRHSTAFWPELSPLAGVLMNTGSCMKS